jgi:two-component system cell cycle sensor histidine kinase/response regulator CckA
MSDGVLVPEETPERLVALLRATFAAQPHATMVLAPDGRLVMLDARAAMMFRRVVGRDAKLGERLADALPAKDAESAVAAIAAAKDGRSITLSHTAVDDDGATVVFDVHAAPMSDGNVCIVAVPIDQRRLRAEEALRHREAQLRAAMEAGRIVPWEWNIGEDSVSRALDIPVTGPSPSDLASFLSAVHPEDRSIVRDALEATLREGEPYAITYRKLAGGATRWLDARAALVRDEAGRPARLVGVVVDITERRKLEDQLVQVQKMDAIGRLAGGVAHDFNNILTAIMTSAHILGRRVGERPELRDIIEAAERAAGLTQQLLTFGRRQILRPTVLDLRETVQGMMSMLRRIVGEDVDVRTEIAPDLKRTRADATQLEQVLMNLAVNARDAMPAGGELHVELSNVAVGGGEATALGLAPGDYVKLRVRDTGVGIDDATQARIFEPFFTTKGAGVGTGLGLATVYGIVVQLGGAIVVDSKPGSGATFDVYFRASEDRAVDSVRTPGKIPTRGTETILLVEDELAVRRSTRLLLETAGYEIIEADDGETAIEIARTRREQIHLIVTDVVMRRTGGVAVAERIREIHPETRVIFVTGYADEAVLRHGLVAGAMALVRKPYTPDTLFSTIRKTLDE